MSVKIAYHSSSEKFIHIDQAHNGLNCGCICIKCNEPLEARQGKVRDWHFKHHVNVNCLGSQETALHELAKQILVNSFSIEIPKYGRIQYSEAFAEKKLERIRPDVSAVYNEQPIYFEVFVSHAVDAGKEKFFKQWKHRSLEIDLSGCMTTSFKEIEELILDRVDNKKVFFWEDEPIIIMDEPKPTPKPSISRSNSNEGSWISVILAILAIFGIYKLTKKKNRRHRK
jgi:competence protein CoiA